MGLMIGKLLGRPEAQSGGGTEGAESVRAQGTGDEVSVRARR